MKKLLIILLTVLVTVTCFTGCSNKPAKSEEQTLYLAKNHSLVTSLDFTPPTQDGSITQSLMWLTLLQADNNLNYKEGEIMKDCEVSEDGKTITMHINEGLKWSDGTDLTMDDVMFTFELYCNKEGSAAWSYVRAAMKYIEGYSAFNSKEADTISGLTVSDDNKTLTIKLTEAYGSFVNLMCQVAVLPKHIYQDVPRSGFAVNEIWTEVKVNSGPYVVTEHEIGNYYILERNPYYSGKKSSIDKVVVTFTSSMTTLAQANEVDYIYTDSADDYIVMQMLKSSYSGTFVPVFYFRYLGFNLFDENMIEKNVVSDARVRQAIAYAIDWKTLIGGLYGDQASFTQTGIKSNSKFYAGDWYEFDQKKAKELLDEANFDYNNSLKIYYYYADQTTKDVMDGIIYYLDQIGVKVEVAYTSTQDYYSKKWQDITYWGLSAFDDLSFYQQYTRPATKKFFSQEVIDTYTPLVKELELAYNDELKAAVLEKLQALDKQYCFYIPVYTLNHQAWVSNSLYMPENCLGNNYFFFDYQFESWYKVK